MDIIKVKSFPTIDEVVDSAVGLLDKDVYGTLSFIGYCDTISTVLSLLILITRHKFNSLGLIV